LPWTWSSVSSTDSMSSSYKGAWLLWGSAREG
jgi:hypothetical protein